MRLICGKGLHFGSFDPESSSAFTKRYPVFTDEPQRLVKDLVGLFHYQELAPFRISVEDPDCSSDQSKRFSTMSRSMTIVCRQRQDFHYEAGHILIRILKEYKGSFSDQNGVIPIYPLDLLNEEVQIPHLQVLYESGEVIKSQSWGNRERIFSLDILTCPPGFVRPDPPTLLYPPHWETGSSRPIFTQIVGDSSFAIDFSRENFPKYPIEVRASNSAGDFEIISDGEIIGVHNDEGSLEERIKQIGVPPERTLLLERAPSGKENRVSPGSVSHILQIYKNRPGHIQLLDRKNRHGVFYNLIAPLEREILWLQILDERPFFYQGPPRNFAQSLEDEFFNRGELRRNSLGSFREASAEEALKWFQFEVLSFHLRLTFKELGTRSQMFKSPGPPASFFQEFWSKKKHIGLLPDWFEVESSCSPSGSLTVEVRNEPTQEFMEFFSSKNKKEPSCCRS